MRHNRNLSNLFDALGADPIGASLPVSEFIQPVYVLDDLKDTLPNRGEIRLSCQFQNAAVAGELAAFELRFKTGMFLHSLVCTTHNFQWGLLAGNSSFVNTPNGIMNVAAMIPEGYGFVCQTLDMSGASLAPLISRFACGTTPGVIPFGLFTVNSRDAIQRIGPLWVPPSTKLLVEATTANAVANFALEVSLPADALLLVPPNP